MEKQIQKTELKKEKDIEKALSQLIKTNEDISADNFLDYYRADMNNLSYWFPKIKDCGIPVPRTLIFQTPEEVGKAYFMDNQSKDIDTVFNYVKNELIPKIPEDMFFLFLKNGTFSNKYDFKTCKVRKNILELTSALIDQNYTSEMFGAGGLSEIIIREFIGSYGYINENIPCIYNGMPLRPEFRFFYDFDIHEVLYGVNYWNYDYCQKSISRNATDKIIYESVYPKINEFYKLHKNEVQQMIEKAFANVKELSGKWSADIMWDEESEQYYLIDMALAENSAYWNF